MTFYTHFPEMKCTQEEVEKPSLSFTKDSLFSYVLSLQCLYNEDRNSVLYQSSAVTDLKEEMCCIIMQGFQEKWCSFTIGARWFIPIFKAGRGYFLEEISLTLSLQGLEFSPRFPCTLFHGQMLGPYSLLALAHSEASPTSLADCLHCNHTKALGHQDTQEGYAKKTDLAIILTFLVKSLELYL